MQDGNLLVPLHGYPMMNQTQLPKRLDFGKCAIGDTYQRTLQLSCKVCIEFEFSITEVAHSEAFSIQPMQGVVPANGHVELTVMFTPTRLATETMIIEVSTSRGMAGTASQSQH